MGCDLGNKEPVLQKVLGERVLIEIKYNDPRRNELGESKASMAGWNTGGECGDTGTAMPGGILQGRLWKQAEEVRWTRPEKWESWWFLISDIATPSPPLAPRFLNKGADQPLLQFLEPDSPRTPVLLL